MRGVASERKRIFGLSKRCKGDARNMDRGLEDEMAVKRRRELGADGGVMSEVEERREPQMEKEVRGAGDVKRGRKHRGIG